MKIKRIIKSFLSVLLIVTLCFSLCGCDEEELKPTNEFFVNDFSEVLDDSVKSEILSRGAALQETTTAQAVVVTIESTNGEEISDYALNLGRDWGIGDEEKDNGILVLLATEDRQIYIAVGYGLEGALPDSKTGRILDNYAIPYLKNDDFSTGILETYKAIVNEIYLEYNIQTDEGYVPVNELPDVETVNEVSTTKIFFSWLIMFVLIALYLAVCKRRRITIFPFITINNNHRGGFGGGSSGGFGGFSGGGGSFGGGGAGRGF